MLCTGAQSRIPVLALNVREDARSQKRSPQTFDAPPPAGRLRNAELESGARHPSAAAIRWPLRKAEPRAESFAQMPVSDETMRAVIAAIQQGGRKAGDIARRTRLGLLTVKDALAEIERRRVKAVETPATLYRGRDVALYPKR